MMSRWPQPDRVGKWCGVPFLVDRLGVCLPPFSPRKQGHHTKLRVRTVAAVACTVVVLVRVMVCGASVGVVGGLVVAGVVAFVGDLG